MKAKALRRFGALAVVGLILGSAPQLHAAFDKGGVLGVGAAADGMGGAFTAIADDSTAAFWNPAGFVQIPRMEVSGFFGPLLNGKEYLSSGAFSMPFYEQTALALTVISLYHDTGDPTTDAFENTYIFSVATPLNVERTVSFGINLKFLQYSSAAKASIGNGQEIQAQASAMGIDLGFLYQVPLPAYGKKVSFGFFAQDLDTVLRWQSGVEETVPLLLAVGGSYWLEENLALDVDYSFFNDQNISGEPLDQPLTDPATGQVITSLEPSQYRPHVGVEGWFFDGHLGLRVGYVGFATTADQFTAGLGYKQSNYGVDYAYMGHAEHLGDSHRLSVHYDFGPGSERPRVVALVNPPTDVAARPANNSVHLSWTPNPDPHVTGYTIYMSKAPGSGYIPIQKRITDTKVIIDGLTNGTRYYFVITAVNNSWPSVESNYSQEVSAVPSPQLPSAPSLGGGPAQDTGPANNWVVPVAGWSVPTGDILGYNLYMSSSPDAGFKKVNDAPITALTYKLTGMEQNKRYFFKLTQIRNDNPPVESPPSPVFSQNSKPDDAAAPAGLPASSGAKP